MLRSIHLYGYGALLVVILALACAWWHDHARLSQRVATLDGTAETLADDLRRNQADQAKRIAMLNGEVDYLVGELQKNDIQIDRMAGGGFRRVYGVVPPEYRIGKAKDLPPGLEYNYGQPVAPGGKLQPITIQR
jgi:hypothetical protein